MKYRPSHPVVNGFRARHAGECTECGWDFDEGDDVAYFDNDLMHAVCAQELCDME